MSSPDQPRHAAARTATPKIADGFLLLDRQTKAAQAATPEPGLVSE
jgi:hypothetical protein